MRNVLILSSAVLVLTACGAKADDATPGTDISIATTTDEGGIVKATSDGKTGTVAIDAPGFKANIAMPKLNMGADNFNMNGVNLYPGSKIISMNVDNVMMAAGSKGPSGATVRIAFDSPAKPEVVKAWFLDKLVKTAKYKLTATPEGMTGKDEKGNPFTLNLRPGSEGHSIGNMTISS
jgi:hypothetical protein